MLTAKRIAALLSMVMILAFMALPAMAAELSVKENRTKSGNVNVAVPYISGSVGGKNIDNMVNQAVLSYVNSQMKQVLSQQEIETFESTHPEPRELSDMLRYNTDLVKYTDKMIEAPTRDESRIRQNQNSEDIEKIQIENAELKKMILELRQTVNELARSKSKSKTDKTVAVPQ